MNDIREIISEHECEEIMAASELQSLTGLWVYSIPDDTEETDFSFQDRKKYFSICLKDC